MYRPTPISQIMFNKYDQDHSGSISVDEFRNLAYSLGYYLNDTELDIAVKKLDRSGSGSITYPDFKAWWGNNDRWNSLKLSDDNMIILSAISGEFQIFDKDMSGGLNKSEFVEFFNKTNKNKIITASDEDEMFKKLDINEDGRISFNEFIDYLYVKCNGDLSQYFS